MTISNLTSAQSVPKVSHKCHTSKDIRLCTSQRTGLINVMIADGRLFFPESYDYTKRNMKKERKIGALNVVKNSIQ